MEADAPNTACLVEKYWSRESESGQEGGEARGRWPSTLTP